LEKWSFQSSLSRGQKQLDATWNSFGDYEGKKKEIGTLFMAAFKFGWEMPRDPVERWDLNPQKECEPTNIPPELKSGDGEDSLVDTSKDSEGINQVSVISHNERLIASDDQNDLFEDPNDVPYLYEIASCINMAAMTQNDEAAIDSAEVAVGALGQAHYATPIRHGNICTYALIIGPSGCGKDSFLQAPAKIVKMFNPKIMLGVAQSAAAIRKEFYREPSRLFVKDEFANFLLRLGNKSDPLNACEGDYLELWSATTGHVLTGFSNKKDEDDSKEVVDGRCSIMGACTIAGLDEVMKKNSSFLSEGLGGRFRLCIFTGGKANSPFSHDGTLTLSPDIMRRLTMIAIGGREEALVKRPMEVQATKTKTGNENKDDKKKDNERGEIVTRTIYPVRSDVQFDGFLADQDGQRGEAAELYKKYHEKFRIDPNNTSRCTVSDSLMARVPDKALRLATKEAILANPTPGESRVTLPMMRFALARTIRQTRATIEAFTTTVGVADEVKIRTAILAYLKGKVSDKNPKGEMKWGSVVQSSRAMKPSPTVNSDMVARIRDRMQDEGLIVIIKGKSKNLELGFRVRLP
jgi:energy-coupling factor transporter ATP-binding protein EcfA2